MHSQEEVDEVIHKLIQYFNYLISQSWQQIQDTFFLKPPYNTHENIINILGLDTSSPRLELEVVSKDNLDPQGCMILGMPSHSYRARVWNLHTHPEVCTRSNIDTMCRQVMGKSCGTFNPNLPSHTDLNTLIKDSLFKSHNAQDYVPVVNGVVCEHGIIWVWPTKEYLGELMHLRSKLRSQTQDAQEAQEIFDDMVFDQSTSHINIIFWFLATYSGKIQNEEELVHKMLSYLKRPSFFSKQVANRAEHVALAKKYERKFGIKSHYIFFGMEDDEPPMWVNKQYEWVYCPLSKIKQMYQQTIPVKLNVPEE